MTFLYIISKFSEWINAVFLQYFSAEFCENTQNVALIIQLQHGTIISVIKQLPIFLLDLILALPQKWMFKQKSTKNMWQATTKTKMHLNFYFVNLNLIVQVTYHIE